MPELSLKREIKTVKTEKDLQELDKVSVDISKEVNLARVRELKFKNAARIGLSVFASLLLVGQNIAVFYLVYQSLQLRQLQNLQLIFATLTAATLTETYFIMKIIVNFVFSSNDYSRTENK